MGSILLQNNGRNRTNCNLPMHSATAYGTSRFNICLKIEAQPKAEACDTREYTCNTTAKHLKIKYFKY